MRFHTSETRILKREGQKLFVIEPQTVFIHDWRAPFFQAQTHIFAQRLGDFQKHIQGDVLRAALDATDVGALGADPICKLLLGDAFLDPRGGKHGDDLLPIIQYHRILIHTTLTSSSINVIIYDNSCQRPDNLLLFSLTILFIKVIRTASPILAKQSLFVNLFKFRLLILYK